MLIFVKFLLVLCALRATAIEQKWERIRTRTPPEVQRSETANLISRIIPSKSNLFNIEIDPNLAPKNKDVVKILSWENGNVTMVNITASTGVAAAMGFHHYLKYHLNGFVSWKYTRVNVPDKLPGVDLVLETQDKFRYMANVCTFGYTYAFWNWTRWERHIDWMALNGINLPLAPIGQEEIWKRVFMRMGLTEKEMDAHFAGPAFLPWQRMGNMDSWGGPLPLGWHAFTVDLQHKILNRTRALGMTPVLPAFSGYVPKAFQEKFSNLTIDLEYWNHFGPTFLLDPKEEMFEEIGLVFIEEYIKEFGPTDHVYTADTFNEMNLPANVTTDFIQATGSSVYQAMSKADPLAVWVMQGWVFENTDLWTHDRSKALLTSVEIGSMIVLDLDSTYSDYYSQLESYFGQPFIFNDLNNFGGIMGMFGRSGRINSKIIQARNLVNGTMVGIGYTPEGLPDTYITTDLLFEMSYRDTPIRDVDKWVEEYTMRRYGQFSKSATSAWTFLFNSPILNSTEHFFNRHILIAQLPALDLKDQTEYTLGEVLKAWKLLLCSAEDLKEVETYKYDLVDLTRQALVDLAPKHYRRAIAAYKDGDALEMLNAAKGFMAILADIEEILASNQNFLLGNWLERAKFVANGSQSDSILYEFNARNQITLWGPGGEILDYAAKQWSGMIEDYYMRRWALFFQELFLDMGKIAPFHHGKFKSDFIRMIGTPFTKSRKVYPTQPHGDSVALSQKIFRKYGGETTCSY